jgi:RNA polymerase sigma factor (sigma-70 family)
LTDGPAREGIERLLRDLAPQVLGPLIRRFHDFAACEDAVQEALLAAAVQWERDGMPENPRAWLIRVAARRMSDHLRSERARKQRETVAATDFVRRSVPGPDSSARTDHDDTLVLLFMCCHPALTPASAIALTLRAVGGLTTAQIAHAFLVPEATMAQRISRARQSIRASGLPFRLPPVEERRARLASVLHVLYLIFNEGYTSSVAPTLHRSDLSREAIRLARVLHSQLPDEPEVAGLLALMLLTDARREARAGVGGELIPLTKQDRALWDRDRIEEGTALLITALARGSVGPYQVQAAIGALHDEAPCVEDTDWAQILALYTLLERMTDSPMVTLNRAIALAMVHGPVAGLERIDALDAEGRLRNHHRLDAVRAHLLELAGNEPAAMAHYRLAAARTTNLPERNYLLTQAARLGDRTRTSTSSATPEHDPLDD